MAAQTRAAARTEAGPPCAVCGRPARAGCRRCYCCRTVESQLGVPLVPVTSIATYEVGGALHRLLRGYKDGPTPALRALRLQEIADRIAAWWERHAGEMDARAGPWEVVTAVPSTRRDRGAADDLVCAVPALAGRRRRLLRRGPVPIGHLRAARRGFVPASGGRGARPPGRRVLVFDDSLTTGARAQSAAFALRQAGFVPVGILVVGRSERRTANPPAQVDDRRTRAGCRLI